VLSLRLVVRLSIDSCLAESRRTKRQCELARQSKILAYVSKFEIKKSAKRPGNQVPQRREFFYLQLTAPSRSPSCSSRVFECEAANGPGRRTRGEGCRGTRRHPPTRAARHLASNRRRWHGASDGSWAAAEWSKAASVRRTRRRLGQPTILRLRRGDQGKHRPQGTSPAFSIFDPAGTWAWRTGPVDAVAVR
jgi:hypothetical protein